MTNIKSTKIRLLLVGQNFQGGRFPDAVGADKPKDLAWTRHRQSMQFE